jgi:lysophospholipase L1-like esterase
MRKWIFAILFVCITLALPVLGGAIGYRVAYQRMYKKPWNVGDAVRKRVESLRQAETVAGALAGLAGLSLDGLEGCYESRPLDFARITWIGPDVPTPFVGYAPAPGPMLSGHINSMQFRYERELAMPKPRGVYRIFLIGGSTTYGAGATSNHTTIGGYLEKQLNDGRSASGLRFEVVTAAAGAWTSTHERVLVENRLIELEPDLVIALSGFNDVHWSLLGRNVLWFRTYQDDYYCLLADSLLSCNFERGLVRTRPGVGEPAGPAEAAKRLRWNVTRTQSALRAAGAEYLFVLQPVLACSRKPRTPREQMMAERVALRMPEADLAEHYRHFQQMLDQVSEPRLRFTDLTSLFDGDAADVFIDGCHFGDRGNDRIAHALSDQVLNILDCRR